MFESSSDAAGVSVLARLDEVLHELGGANLDSYPDESVLELLRGLEIRVRRLASIDHSLIAQIERRGLARERGATSTTSFLARLLRLSHGEARGRVAAAEQLAPRQVAGQILEPEFPQTAAAQADGAISPTHARIVTRILDTLPARIRDEQFDTLETQLVGWARDFTPEQLSLLGRHLHDVLDPDGTLRDAKHRERTRDLTIRQRPDGSVSGTFEGTAQFGEALLTVLDKLAAPAPADDGSHDPRTPGQRRHDGLLDGLLSAIRSGELGSTHGVSTTIVVTVTADQAATRDGLARTGHGATIRVRDALKHIGDARVFPVVLGGESTRLRERPAPGPPDRNTPTRDPSPEPGSSPGLDSCVALPLLGVREVAAYGTTHRIFTESQRLAMAARDHGCAFPGCTVGAAWTQAHHMTEWQLTRRTSVDDGCLLCGYHHREFERLGWRGRMSEGVPHWLAPVWLDPTQTWQRNTAHDAAALV